MDDNIFGQSKGRLTPMMEAILHTMYFHEQLGKASNLEKRDRVLAVNSGFFSELLGIRWQGYHYKLMEDLEAWAWVTSFRSKSGRSIHWTLTKSARVALGAHVHMARQNTTWFDEN